MSSPFSLLIGKKVQTKRSLTKLPLLYSKRTKCDYSKLLKKNKSESNNHKSSKIRLIRRKARKRNFDGANAIKQQNSLSPVKSIKELLKQTNSYTIVNDKYEDIVNKINVFKETAQLLSGW